jgi:hypothetical protein
MMRLNGYLMMPSLLHAHGYEGFGTVVPEQLVDGMRGVESDSRPLPGWQLCREPNFSAHNGLLLKRDRIRFSWQST